MVPSSRGSLSLVLLFGMLVGSGVTWSALASQPGEGLIITGGNYSETPEQKERRERSERLFKQKVDTVAARLGEHRRAEAERLVRMQEAAEAARPKQIAPTRSADRETGNCSERRISANEGFSSNVSEADAREKAQVFSNRECSRGTLTCGGITCRDNTRGLPQNLTVSIRYQCTLTATRMQRFCDGSRVSGQ